MKHSSQSETIQDVSDTALWVAAYRVEETKRKDALFHDPLASRLVGARGETIARAMAGSRYTAWSIVIRTCIIDRFIGNLVANNVDTVINLGAGLDTRPYRLNLPASLHWVEVDFPNIIDLKEERLRDEKPQCKLTRVKLDLSDREARTSFFKDVSAPSQNILILTEGVIPYLSNDQVAELAQDLRSYPSFKFWIVDYFSPLVFRFMKKGRRARQLKNAPFLFEPQDWFTFFPEKGWKLKEMRYYREEAELRGRTPPIPWWGYLARIWMSEARRDQIRKLSGYAILEPAPSSAISPSLLK